MDDATKDGAAGYGWFKLWDDGFENDSWCTTQLINGNGLMTVNLPKGLFGGYYLVRTELLALHKANQGDPQYYVQCAQVYIQSSGNLVPNSQDTVGIPGYVTAGDASDSYNLWASPSQNNNNYPLPGPAPAALVNGATTNTANLPSTGKPSNCVLEAGNNWCGTEVPSYSDQSGCQAVSP